MKRRAPPTRVSTGIRNLDGLLEGGLPRGAAVIVAGSPGAGKTILAQQIAFHTASKGSKVAYFCTLSEPTAKTLRYASQFAFFEEEKLEWLSFVDLGEILRTKGLEKAGEMVMNQVKQQKPALVVIDSFKVFDDLARDAEELRKFCYELVVKLMAWECTTLLLGEDAPSDYESNPSFSIVDGLITLTQRQVSGERLRLLHVVKLRGTAHSSEEHSFVIGRAGLELFTPRETIRREPSAERQEPDRVLTGMANLDALLGEGIPRGSSLLVAGVAGTGKTVLGLEFVYRGAQQGEKGVMFSFEETAERLLATARELGWDLDGEVERGMVEIVFIPQPDIAVERHLVMMRERIEAIGAQRIAIDSISVFLHRVTDPQVARDKVFQLASVVQNARGIGFFATDIPYGSSQISRFGVEETVVDGVILLSSSEEGLERRRYLEVYKLRNTAHLKGRHSMVIGRGGMSVFPRYLAEMPHEPPPPVEPDRRLGSGVPGLDPLLGGGLLARSVTLVSGSPGVGKTTLGAQFLLAGAAAGERGLLLSLEEGPDQLLRNAGALGLPLAERVSEGSIQVAYLSGEVARAPEFLATLLERVKSHGASRLVVDGISHIEGDSPVSGELRRVISSAAFHSKQLGLTSLFMLESAHMFPQEALTGHELSPIADNIVLLRYLRMGDELVQTITIIKTRGSGHGRGTHPLRIERGGMRVEPSPCRGLPHPDHAGAS